MDGFWNMAAVALATLYIVSSLMPSWKADYWWVRIWDFPRAQMAVLGLLCLGWMFRVPADPMMKWTLIAFLIVGLALDAYRIYPYTFLHSIEVHKASTSNKDNRICILEANVLQTNRNYEAMRQLIRENSPDIIFLLETDQPWVDAMREFESTHPHTLLRPLDNTYGLAFYSRLPLAHSKINFLIEPEIPSIETEVILPSGATIQLYGIHPRPPRPQDEVSTERDAELITIAKSAAANKKPVIVFGDLNDVAWSHTTRLFRRISRLLDPRVGRGFYPTFPAGWSVLRFPIDHVFVSDAFRVVDLQRMPKVGSDHHPLRVIFSYEPQHKDEQKAPKPTRKDQEEAQEMMAEVK